MNITILQKNIFLVQIYADVSINLKISKRNNLNVIGSGLMT